MSSRGSKKSRFEATDQVLEAELPADLHRRTDVIEKILDQLRRSGCQIDDYVDRLCIDEAMINAIVHGSRENSEKKIRLRVLVSDGDWGVEIIDEGDGFDWRSAIERRPEDLDPESATGRGIALIVASGMDLEYSDGGRRLLISRRASE